MNEKIRNQGFTLVELSIVIVIIGLIVAGVVGGQKLVEQSKLRSVMTGINKHAIAINAFELEYNAIPGDIPNAQDFFPSCSNSGGNTCNGNGDKDLKYAENTAGTGRMEGWRAHPHLLLAGLYDGYSLTTPGAVSGNAAQAVIGDNVPKTSFNNSAYCLGHTNTPIKRIGEVRIFIGAQTGGWSCVGDAFTHNHLLKMDTKSDDGLPNSGSITSWSVTDNSCRSNVITAYDLSNPDVDCAVTINLRKF